MRAGARYNDGMPDEPSLLGDPPVEAEAPKVETATPAPKVKPVERKRTAPSPEAKRPAPKEGDAVHVAGFWRRMLAGLVDLAVILPVSLVLTWIASRMTGVHLPTSRIKGLDFWLDLLLASDPALMTAFAMLLFVTCAYLMTFQVVLGRTLGMRLLKMRVIDVWGDRPSILRCAARTGGYVLGAATVMLGFLWVGFDSEKRGLHDWIAGTYVIKA